MTSPHLLPLARMGHPILREKAVPVDLTKLSDVQEIVNNMRHTLESLGDRLGLAAPQVHVPLRIVIFKIPKAEPSQRYTFDCNPGPLTVMINPEITQVNDEKILGWEGCISVPGMVGEVERHKSIVYSFYDISGTQHTREAHGFHARIVQHECDHLDGILFPTRIGNMNRFGFEDEVIQYLKGK